MLHSSTRQHQGAACVQPLPAHHLQACKLSNAAADLRCHTHLVEVAEAQGLREVPIEHGLRGRGGAVALVAAQPHGRSPASARAGVLKAAGEEQMLGCVCIKRACRGGWAGWQAGGQRAGANREGTHRSFSPTDSTTSPASPRLSGVRAKAQDEPLATSSRPALFDSACEGGRTRRDGAGSQPAWRPGTGLPGGPPPREHAKGGIHNLSSSTGVPGGAERGRASVAGRPPGACDNT